MLNLLVIWSQESEALVEFYAILGIQLLPEQHGKGPQHYAAQGPASTVFEIYPATSDEKVTRNIRLGFEITQLDTVLAQLTAAGFAIHQPAKASAWGYRAVVLDPEGRKVELIERPEA